MTAQYEVERFWMGGLKRAVMDGDVTKGSMMAGQSVGLVDEIKSLDGIMSELVGDAEKTLETTYHTMRKVM